MGIQSWPSGTIYTGGFADDKFNGKVKEAGFSGLGKNNIF